MDVIKNKDSEETGIKLDFKLDSGSSGDETDPDQTQALDIQASPDETPPVSPVMQREAGGNSMPQDMSANEIVTVQFDALAKSKLRRKPPSCGKLSSQELNSLLRKEKPKDIKECINMIEEAIHAKAGTMEALVTVTRVAAIAIGYADVDRRKKESERRKEHARKRKELKEALKAQQAEAARIEMQEAQVAVMSKH